MGGVLWIFFAVRNQKAEQVPQRVVLNLLVVVVRR